MSNSVYYQLIKLCRQRIKPKHVDDKHNVETECCPEYMPFCQDEQQNDQTCAICLTTYDACNVNRQIKKQQCCMLPSCGHFYCTSCIQQWKLYSTRVNDGHANCPLCKQRF